MKFRTQVLIGMVLLASLIVALPAPGQTGSNQRIVATDYPSLQDAVNAARQTGIYRIYVPAGVYLLEKTLDLTMFTAVKEGDRVRYRSLTFEGAGRATQILARTGGSPALDLSGSSCCILQNFELVGQNADCGILMARVRNPDGPVESAGGHCFSNVYLDGVFTKTAVLSWGSEANRWVNCAIANDVGDAYTFTCHNIEQITSPYVQNAPGYSAELRFFGCSLSVGGRDTVGLRVSGGSDVLFEGGYITVAVDAFAGVYLDGTYEARNVTLRDIRCEVGGYHDLYAVGNVSEIVIEGGEWVSGAGENVLYENKVPASTGAHRAAFSSDYDGRACNWLVRGVRFSRGLDAETAKKIQQKGRFAALYFESLLDSRIEHIAFQPQYIGRGRKSGSPSVTIANDVPLVVVEQYSRRNFFEVPSRPAVVLGGDAQNNHIVALADDTGVPVPPLWLSGSSSAYKKGDWSAPRFFNGIRRTYLNPDDGLSIVNLGVRNVYEIEKPQAGDFVLHDGTGFADSLPRLAVYAGNQWLFFKLDTPAAEKKE